MYKRVLLTTDGSALSNAVALEGVGFAQMTGAEVVGLFVAPEFQHPIYVEVLPPDYPTDAEYRQLMRKTGEEYLAAIRTATETAGLRFTGLIEFSDLTAKKIAHVADDQHCDLIFMGSHGRSGLGQLLLGSVTAKVLSITDIPVLVHRIKSA